MTTQMLSRVLVAAALSAAAACAGAKQGSTTTGSRNTEVLTAEEVMKTGQPTAYRAIQTARPQWLVVRPQGSSAGRMETVKAYVQGNPYGEVRALDQIQAASVKEIRHLDSRDATMRYGTGHGGGAILVTLY